MLAMIAARTTGIPLPARSAYPQIPKRRVATLGMYDSRFANIAMMPATTATFHQLATTRWESPLVRYVEYSSSDIPVPSQKRMPRASHDSLRGKSASTRSASHFRNAVADDEPFFKISTSSARNSGMGDFLPVTVIFFHLDTRTSSSGERRSTGA